MSGDQRVFHPHPLAPAFRQPRYGSLRGAPGVRTLSANCIATSNIRMTEDQVFYVAESVKALVAAHRVSRQVCFRWTDPQYRPSRQWRLRFPCVQCPAVRIFATSENRMKPVCSPCADNCS
jgi:hypothetical protein